MMTQLESAKKGLLTPEMKICAKYEGVDTNFILQGVANGFIVIPANVNHTNLIPRAIGKIGCTTTLWNTLFKKSIIF